MAETMAGSGAQAQAGAGARASAGASAGASASVGERAALCVGLIVAVAIGARYAIETPLWQAPDEPAHFNYIAQLADGQPGHPRIEPGDYPAERLEDLKAAGFGPGADIAGIEYEDHQPPAYYAVAALAFRAGGPGEARRALLVRLTGVLLASVTTALAWAIVHAASPRANDASSGGGRAGFGPAWPAARRAVALAAAAGVAFTPMHVAITASINNDVLADIAIAAALYVALRRATGRMDARGFVACGGAALGLALLAKLTVYIAAIVLVAAEAARWSRDGRRLGGHAVRTAAGALAVGGAVAAPWFARNLRVYGVSDPFGLVAHARVVVGQPTTAEWIAREGVAATVERGVVWTFQSFWGVFGWMGVFMDRRIYAALAAYALVAAIGFVGHALRAARRGGDERRALALFALTAAASLGGYLWYNLSYVQHQGRYLFPALIPLAASGALGVAWIVDRAAALVGFGATSRRRLAHAGLLGASAGTLGLALLALERYVIPGL